MWLFSLFTLSLLTSLSFLYFMSLLMLSAPSSSFGALSFLVCNGARQLYLFECYYIIVHFISHLSLFPWVCLAELCCLVFQKWLIVPIIGSLRAYSPHSLVSFISEEFTAGLIDHRVAENFDLTGPKRWYLGYLRDYICISVTNKLRSMRFA